MADFKLLLPDGHGIIGTVDDGGVVTFIVSAAPGTPIRGTEMFNLMMRAFGTDVRAVQGVWRRGFQGRPSVNLDKVNELTSKGVSLEAAVLETWTAKRARRWGFGKITITEVPEGEPGAYSKIDVFIER